MIANQEPWRGAQETSREESRPASDRESGDSSTDAEQARREMFHDAVQKRLARQARGRREAGWRGSPPGCTEILTSDELDYLLRKDF